MKHINFKYYRPGVLITVVFLVATLLVPAKSWMMDHWGVYLAVPTAILALLFLIDQWLWRVPIVRMMVMTVPDMRGTYTGIIQFENEEGKPGTLDCEITIRQTGSDVWVESRFLKDDGSLSSPSDSNTAEIVKKDKDTYKLIFTYLNEGSDHLSTHRGTNDLDFRVIGKVKSLSGRYYTNRRTKGSLEATTDKQ